MMQMSETIGLFSQSLVKFFVCSQIWFSDDRDLWHHNFGPIFSIHTKDALRMDFIVKEETVQQFNI